jgi:hypothetical protein
MQMACSPGTAGPGTVAWEQRAQAANDSLQRDAKRARPGEWASESEVQVLNVSEEVDWASACLVDGHADSVLEENPLEWQ